MLVFQKFLKHFAGKNYNISKYASLFLKSGVKRKKKSYISYCIFFRFLELYTLWHYSLWQQQQYSKIGMAPGQAEIHCHYIGINGGNHMQYSNGFSKTPYRNVKTTVCPKIHGVGIDRARQQPKDH